MCFYAKIKLRIDNVKRTFFARSFAVTWLARFRVYGKWLVRVEEISCVVSSSIKVPVFKSLIFYFNIKETAK